MTVFGREERLAKADRLLFEQYKRDLEKLNVPINDFPEYKIVEWYNAYMEKIERGL